jgi:hypothetical protein
MAEIYPRMLWELVADPLVSAEQTLVTTALDDAVVCGEYSTQDRALLVVMGERNETEDC